MHCSKCGVAVADGTSFCGSCGQPIVGYSVAPSAVAPSAGGSAGAPLAVAAVGGRAYAGFWLRFVAYLIDSLVAMVVIGIVAGLAIGILGVEFFREHLEEMGRGMSGPNPAFPAMLMLWIATFAMVVLVLSWLYFAGMESSEHQGTLGTDRDRHEWAAHQLCSSHRSVFRKDHHRPGSALHWLHHGWIH
jgi:hypothetical protein